MGRADPDRSGHPAAATAGTLDSGEQAAEETGQTQGQAEGGPAGQAGAGPPGIRAAVPRPRQAMTGTGRVRAAFRAPVARHIGILLAFIVAGAAATMPLAANLAGRIPAARDPASYVWDFSWVAHQLTHLGNPWFTTAMAAPVGFHTLMALPGALFTPVTLALGPGVSYNLLVTILPGLLCYAMYRAARLWLRSATGAVAAAVFFGLSCMLTQQDWYHLNIALGALFLPLALEASVRLRRQPGRRQGIILGLVMGVAVLTDQESAVLAAIVVGLVLLPWLLRRPGWARLWPVLLACVTGTVVASPQIVAMLQEIVASHGGLSIPPKLLAVSYKQYGIGLPGMFTPTPRVSTFGLKALASPFLHGRDNEGMPMFGTTLTVLALAGLVASWRRRAGWQLAALWIGCAALALGTSLWIGKHQYLPLASVWNGVRVSNLMPYTWFVRLPAVQLPGGRPARDPRAAGRRAARRGGGRVVPLPRQAGARRGGGRRHPRIRLRRQPEGGHDPGQLPGRGPGHPRRPHQLDRARPAVRAARRDPGRRGAVLPAGAGDGHRGRPPALDRLHLPGAAADHQRDQQPPVLRGADRRPARGAGEVPVAAGQTAAVAEHLLPPQRGIAARARGRGEPGLGVPQPSAAGGGPAGRGADEHRLGRGLEAQQQHQHLSAEVPPGDRVPVRLPAPDPRQGHRAGLQAGARRVTRLAGPRCQGGLPGQQALGCQGTDDATQAQGQASLFFRGQTGEDALLAGLPGLPEAAGHGPALRGEIEPDIAVVLLVPPPADPALALQARGQAAHRALLQAEQGRELALGDAVRGEQLGERAGLRGRDGGHPRRRGAVLAGAVRASTGRAGGRAQRAQQQAEKLVKLRAVQCGIHRNSCTPQLRPWYVRAVRVAPYNYGFGRHSLPHAISSPL